MRDAIDPEIRWLAVLGRSDPEELKALVASTDVPARFRGRALRQLSCLVGPELEPSLLDLVRADDKGARDAALITLESVGSLAAVAPLLEILEQERLDANTSARVRKLVQRIQGQVPAASKGHVSLVSPVGEGGELSETSHEGGALSEWPDKTSRRNGAESARDCEFDEGRHLG